MANPLTGVHTGKTRFIAPFLLIFSMLGMIFLYLKVTYPELFVNALEKSLTSSVTVDEITQNKERERLNRIRNLLISEAQKKALVNGSPFIGAGPHMIELAFRQAPDDSMFRRRGELIYDFQRYGFSGNREPVVMEYLNGQLICIHYVQREETKCGLDPQTAREFKSYYHGYAFPFSYRVQVQ